VNRPHDKSRAKRVRVFLSLAQAEWIEFLWALCGAGNLWQLSSVSASCPQREENRMWSPRSSESIRLTAELVKWKKWKDNQSEVLLERKSSGTRAFNWWRVVESFYCNKLVEAEAARETFSVGRAFLASADKTEIGINFSFFMFAASCWISKQERANEQNLNSGPRSRRRERNWIAQNSSRWWAPLPLPDDFPG
jgi:hypothetical protein